LGAAIFILSGVSIIIANYFGKIQMYQMEGYSRPLRLMVFQIAKYFQNPRVDMGTFSLLLIIGYLLLVIRRNKNEKISKK
jgi:hypothetical protein